MGTDKKNQYSSVLFVSSAFLSAKNSFINRFPIRKLKPQKGIKQVIGEERGGAERDVVDHKGATRPGVAHEPMPMLPIPQKEGEFGAFVHKENLVRSRLLVNNVADPVLFKKDEIEP